MTRLQAKRELHQLGKEGNWRFKGLLLAALPNQVTQKDVARAWPTKPGEYRFLQQNPKYDPTRASKEQLAVEMESDDHRFLSEYAGDALTEDETHELATAQVDNAIKHALFAAATPEELDTLFRDQLADVVADGARRRQVARDASFIFNSDTRNGDLPTGQDGEYNYESGSGGIAEGGIIQDDREDFGTVAFSCKKIGVGARITDEMVDHSMIDIIERQIEWVGRVTENDLNRIWINELVDNATASSTTGTDKGLPALNGGITEVDKNDYTPDSFVSHPEFREELFNDSNLVYVNRAGQDQELREREIGRVLGIDHFPMNNAAYDSGSEDWAYTGGSDVGAVVYQQDKIALVIHRDVEVKDYDDPIRDLQGVNTRAWVDAVYTQPDAAAQVIHS